ncbi:uncharacterized protein LOC107013487 [Solanum pennellii]|uniref:Uncharacterized protein LOC107013487 n=1 Tax=Solanum pennellii TaxID=28526 RepID=A0ABM1GBU8_SOLPN|nr:uncharacterized protein LOC107013487 [Solanum pennellii]
MRQTDIGPRASTGTSTSTQSTEEEKNETITPVYPWATSRHAIVHTLDYLVSKEITIISGEVQCQKCQQQYKIQYELQDKVNEIAKFIFKNRAPNIWMTPNLPNCKYCNQRNCFKPIISKDESINWLFLLLGQATGFYKIDQLKYFCKHTKIHRTRPKNRFVYLTYMELCKQLDPRKTPRL